MMNRTLDISKLVPRRADGTQGRRPPGWPDLNFRRMASDLGLSSTFVGRVMNGRVRTSVATAEKLSVYLGWPMERVAALYEGDKAQSKKFPYRKQEQEQEPK